MRLHWLHNKSCIVALLSPAASSSPLLLLRNLGFQSKTNLGGWISMTIKLWFRNYVAWSHKDISSMLTVLSFGHTRAQQLDKSEVEAEYWATMLGNPALQLNAQAPIWGTLSSNYWSEGDHLGTLPGASISKLNNSIFNKAGPWWLKLLIQSTCKFIEHFILALMVQSHYEDSDLQTDYCHL